MPVQTSQPGNGGKRPGQKSTAKTREYGEAFEKPGWVSSVIAELAEISMPAEEELRHQCKGFTVKLKEVQTEEEPKGSKQGV